MTIQKNQDGSVTMDAETAQALADMAKEKRAKAEARAAGPFTAEDDAKAVEMRDQVGTPAYRQWVRDMSAKAKDWRAGK